MSLLISTRSELLKTKRSASFWLSLCGAGLIPLMFILGYMIKPDSAARSLQMMPWEQHFVQGYQAFSAFLLPMFVILLCSLIPQIEYKNNTWKQVFATPQSVGNIFLSKFIAIVLMITFLFVMFNLLMILSAVIPDLFHSQFTFLDNSIPVTLLLRLNAKTFISLLGIIAIQYWLSLRFKNFIVPIGIGLALLIAATIVGQMRWEHVYKVPYAFPILTFQNLLKTGGKDMSMLNHEWNSIAWFIAISVIAFLDMRYRKERG